ncbi:MAG: hypothetical protein AAGI91_05445 [Bacteroidota bacterium]
MSDLSRMPLRRQLPALLKALGVVYLPLGLLLALIGVVGYTTETIHIAHLTRDPAAVAKMSSFTGVVSNVGVLLWTVTAATCLFTARTLWRVPAERMWAGLLLSAGCLTVLLTVDDLFMLHDGVIQRYLRLPGKVLYAVYGLSVIAGTVAYGRTILESNYVLLVLAIACLAASVGVDALADGSGMRTVLGSRGLVYLLEDGFKLLGIGGWASYFVGTCYASVVRTQRVDLRADLVRSHVA